MQLDKDLQARQEARTLAKQAENAQKELFFFSQEKLDAIVRAVAKAFSASAAELAQMAVEETGFGNVEDKITKNKFASQTVLEAIEPMKTVGILKETPGLWEVGVPVGVIAAIISMSSVFFSSMTSIASSTVTIPTRRISLSTMGNAKKP